MVQRLLIDIIERQKNQPINQWVYDLLWTNIIELHLEPGGPLSETEVAETLGVSRTPVRESFIKLVKDGLLRVIPQKGSIVSEIDLEQARSAWFVRRAVEENILSEACKEFPERNLCELESNIKLQEECFADKDFGRFLAADNNFHRIVYQGCNKELIWVDIIKKLDFNYDRLRIMTLPHMTTRVIDDHRDMLRIIANKEPAEISDVIERHLTWSVIDKVINEYPPRFFNPPTAPRRATGPAT